MKTSVILLPLLSGTSLVSSLALRAYALNYASPEARIKNLPYIQLPDARYQARSYDQKYDLYTFKNIRFGAPPVGDLRWRKPQSPAINATLQTGEYGPACPQGDPTTVIAPTFGGFLGFILGNAGSLVNVGQIASGAGELGEDCLFLDIIVPGRALRGEAKMPVVNWIYGGAYLIVSARVPVYACE
jgi:hypothetical protein